MTTTTNKKQGATVSFLLQLGHGYEPHKTIAQNARSVRFDSESSAISYVRWRIKNTYSIQSRLSVVACREIDGIARIACARAKNAPLATTVDEKVGGNAKRVEQRAVNRLGEIYRKEIVRRGGETTITERDGETRVTVVDRRDGLCLLRADGWRQYSKSYGARRASISYLCGTDDSGRWSVRVPGTIEHVSSALEWIEPAEVKAAKKQGLAVLRQGDVYAVQTVRKALDGTGDRLPAGHEWDAVARTLTHTEHSPLHVEFPCRFFMQKAYVMGRSGRMGSAD
jgi:hypothetical protein